MARSAARSSAVRLGLPALALGLVAALAAAPANASLAPAPADETGILMNYAINSDKGADAMAVVADLVDLYGGEVLTQYVKIGVTVAQSTRGQFANDLRGHGDVIDSVGATRTSEVGSTLPPKPGFEDYLRAPIDEEPREDEQWGNTVLESLEANEIEDGRRSVIVGVIDSGVNDLHEDLQANFNEEASVDCVTNEGGPPNTAPGAWRPTVSTHGTHVAGTIAAARNGLGIAGIAPGVQVASLRAMNDSGYLFPEYVMCAFMWAAKKDVDITNNSYYMDPWYFWCKNDPDQGAVQESLKRVIAYTHKRGIINVAAAGNEDYDLAHKTTDSLSPNDSEAIPNRPVNRNCLDIPTEIDGVVTTAAISQSLAKASFSNFGLGKIDVAAPGVSILSTTWPGTSSYGFLSGTSMASPHVAGVVALIDSVEPGLSVEQMLKRLYNTSVDRACPAGDPDCEGTPENNGYFGRGIVNALNAVS